MFYSTALSFIDDEKDKDLFIRICEEYRDFMLAVATRSLANGYQHLAEDAVQVSLIALAKNMDSLKRVPSDKIKPFLHRVVRCKAIDIVRHEDLLKNPQSTDFDGLVNEIPGTDGLPIDSIVSKEGYEYLKSCISLLNDHYRAPLELKLIYDLNDASISKMLEISPSNVRVRIARGKAKLCEMLQDYKKEGQ